MAGLVITTDAAQACPNCENSSMVQEMTMKHGVTQKLIDDLLAAGKDSVVRSHATSVTERCSRCGWTTEAG